MFPPIYSDNETCPLPGYEGFVFRVLANPTLAEKLDWFRGNLGGVSCPDCAALQAADPAAHCAECSARRDQFGRAACVVFGTSRVTGFDFSTPDAALASFAQDLPSEFVSWLYMLPNCIWEARQDDLKKKLTLRSTSATTS